MVDKGATAGIRQAPLSTSVTDFVSQTICNTTILPSPPPIIATLRHYLSYFTRRAEYPRTHHGITVLSSWVNGWMGKNIKRYKEKE